MKRFFKAFKMLGMIENLEKRRDELSRDVEHFEQIRQGKFNDLNKEIEAEKEKEMFKFKAETSKIEKQIESLKATELKYHQLLAEARKEYEAKQKEVNGLNDQLMLIEHGFTKFNSENLTTAKYKPLLDENLRKQKQMIRDGSAAEIFQKYLVNNSEKEGAKLQKDNVKFLLRSFNNESENAMSKLRFSNYEATHNKIEKSHTALNKLNARNGILITDDYLDLVLEELELRYKLNIAKEEEKEQLRILREEERERKAIEKEIAERDKELKRERKEAESALRELQAEYEKESELENQNQELLAEIRRLQDSLLLIDKKQEENMNYNEIGKSGYVYIISNRGAFGEDVFKVGMTRRLEPLDRIRELSGASVPFPFDIHALVLTDDAPALENKLHKELSEYRVNLVNNRKEFFSLPMDELRETVVRNSPNCLFNSEYESEQYVESLKIRNSVAS